MTPIQSPLHRFAVEGDIAKLQALLDTGAEIDAVVPGGYTALILAALAGQSECVRLLIDRGADVHAKDQQQRHALLYAAFKEGEIGDHGTVAALLAAGADVNMTNDWGENALLWAAGGRNDLEIVRLLLEHGAHVDAANGHGQTALMDAAEAGRLETVRELLRYNASPQIQDVKGQTALQYAREYNHQAIVELLSSATI